jgi:hypothetical protein
MIRISATTFLYVLGTTRRPMKYRRSADAQKKLYETVTIKSTLYDCETWVMRCREKVDCGCRDTIPGIRVGKNKTR